MTDPQIDRYSTRIFRRYLFAQALVWVAMGGVAALASRWLGDQWYIVRAGFWMAASALFVGASTALGIRYLGPLRRLLGKAQEVVAGVGSEIGAHDRASIRGLALERIPRGIPVEAVSGEEAEWSELEVALDRIRSGLHRETEALRREREELAILMGSIGDAILAVDQSGRVLFFNSRFALLFGDRDLNHDVKTLAEIFRAPEVLGAFREALDQGHQAEASLRSATRIDGDTQRFFQLQVSPLRRGEETYGAVGVFHDVTELKRAEQIRIEFVANVSHELRTPLTSIKGFADTLKDDISSGRVADAPQFVEKITRNADRLMALINDLLDLSSLESGQEVQRDWVSTEEVTRRVLERLEPLRLKKNQQVKQSYLAPKVFAQSTRLEQVLTNLVENALKYSGAAVGKVEISWEPSERGGVLLRVADNGPGVAPEHQARLFERFYRIDKGRSREMGGTGLGLAIVKHILQSHGGSVYVTSDPGEGAEFVCQFPGE